MRENALIVLILLDILFSGIGADLQHCNFMCKRQSCPRVHHECIQGSGGIAPPILKSALDGEVHLLHAPTVPPWGRRL